jgi:hypothetical protein
MPAHVSQLESAIVWKWAGAARVGSYVAPADNFNHEQRLQKVHGNC